MGKKLSQAEVARYERDGLLFPVDAMRPWFRLAVIGILLLLVGGGCSDTGASSDNDKRGVFYGGVSGGRTCRKYAPDKLRRPRDRPRPHPARPRYAVAALGHPKGSG